MGRYNQSLHGAHQLKFGADVRGPIRNIYLDVPALRGSYTFNGNRTGIGMADFLLGYPSAAQLSNPAVVDFRMKMFLALLRTTGRSHRSSL
jgi:hypothetical protein